MSARLLLLLLSALSLAGAQGRLIWQDEFDGPAGSLPDKAKWAFDLGGGGWGNRELETYTDSTANIFQDGDGHLVIRATKTDTGAYRSARIKTQGLFAFTYGRAEARMKLPKGQGIWPAFWMLGEDIKTAGWPKCGEIDIMENIGREPDTVHGTIHGPGYSGAHGISAPFVFTGGVAPSDGYHVYAVIWSPNQVQFAVDDKVYETIASTSIPAGTKWVYDHPFFLLFDLAVGGAWPGNPDGTYNFPARVLHRLGARLPALGACRTTVLDNTP